MEPLEGISLVVLLLVGVVAYMSWRDRKNKKRIEEEIRLAGGEPIEVAFQFVGYDRDNQHYNVHFADELGRKHETRCKVNVWNSGMYWQRTPAELLIDLPAEDGRPGRPAADPADSKEQIIDDLVAENERLRARLLRAEASNGGLKPSKAPH